MMLSRYINQIKQIISRNQVEIILLILWLLIVFHVLPEVPYLNLLLSSITAKALLVWVFLVLSFNIKPHVQTKLLIIILAIALLAALFDFAMYESLGNAIFVLLVVNVLTYLRETRKE